MPLIKQKPSLNHKVIKEMTLKDLKSQHPLADEAHLESEWHTARGTTPESEVVVEEPEKAKSKAK